MAFQVLIDYLIAFVLQKSIFFYIIGFCTIFVIANKKTLKEQLKYYMIYLVIYELVVFIIHMIQLFSRR